MANCAVSLRARCGIIGSIALQNQALLYMKRIYVSFKAGQSHFEIARISWV